MRPYTDVPGLSEIVLEESYVLGIHAQPAEVAFDVDFVLTKGHPAYALPPTSEVECYRKGRLAFFGIERLRWDDQGAPPATDASGEIDYGHVDSFEWDDTRYVLEGDWGRMELTARTLEVQIED